MELFKEKSLEERAAEASSFIRRGQHSIVVIKSASPDYPGAFPPVIQLALADAKSRGLEPIVRETNSPVSTIVVDKQHVYFIDSGSKVHVRPGDRVTGSYLFNQAIG